MFGCLGLSGGFLDATTILPSPPRPPRLWCNRLLEDLVMDCLGGVVFLLFLFVIFLIMSVGPEESFSFLLPVPLMIARLHASVVLRFW